MNALPTRNINGRLENVQKQIMMLIACFGVVRLYRQISPMMDNANKRSAII